MKIEVTQEHIEQGRPRIYHSCPIALAVLATGAEDVVVGSNIYICT